MTWAGGTRDPKLPVSCFGGPMTCAGGTRDPKVLVLLRSSGEP